MDKVRHALEVAKTSLIIDYPFLGYISARMSFEENPDAIRFSVNPRGDVLYNRKFLQERVLKYTDGQLYLEAMLAHEVLHMAFQHYAIDCNSADVRAMNLAKDLEVNNALVYGLGLRKKLEAEAFEHHPLKMRTEKIDLSQLNPVSLLGCCPDENGKFFINNTAVYVGDLPAEEIYKEISHFFNGKKSPIHQDTKKRTDLIKGWAKNIDIDFSGNDFGLRNSDTYHSGNVGNANDNEIDEVNSSSNVGEDGQSGTNNPFGFDEHNDNDVSDEEKNDLASQWEDVIVCAQGHQEMQSPNNVRGYGNDFFKRFIRKLLKPQIDWRAVLRRNLQNIMPFDFSYEKPAARSYAVGFYEPHILRKPLGITVCIDVSGSITNKTLEIFISEIVNIAKQVNDIKIRCLAWSTYVSFDDIFTRRNISELVESGALVSGGGTEISCVKKYLDENPDIQTSSLFVFLTDSIAGNEFSLPQKSLVVISPDGNDVSFDKNIQIVKMQKTHEA